MTDNRTRALPEPFAADLLGGRLTPLLDLVKRDRDLILELRGDYASIYCKGQQLGKIAPTATGYSFQCDTAFWADGSAAIATQDDATALVCDRIPHIKQAIAEHAPGRDGREIEVEQSIIRANNSERIVASDYFMVDRQVLPRQGTDRLDVLAVHWPCTRRGQAKELHLAVVEVKYGLDGGVEKVAAQLQGYHAAISADMPTFAEGAEALLRQKLRLGLITPRTRESGAKLESLPVSRDPATLRAAVALVDYNPNSTRLDLAALHALPFADRLDVFLLGYGMWSAYGLPAPAPAAETAAPAMAG
ncbi:hypothetical protein ACM64Y_15415 [Novispirillum sp. DQ9]|uniref:hypothetical protein n=1 Tax=Novispirillum sp. DQ9 TaxID=3398612 RepID=UPI003C7C8E14